MAKFWNFKANGEDTGELQLYGEISSSSWFGDEVTPKQFKQDLDALGSIKQLTIFINSGGGDVFAGQAIHSMLRRHEAKKTVYVDGLAASIASVIAMAGDKIIMPSNAMMMIHNAWSMMAGNAEDFRKRADALDKIDESLVAAYQEKTGMDIEEIKSMMGAETWMTAEDAVIKGFADEIEQSKKVAASVKGGFLMLGNQEFELSRYKGAVPKVDEIGLIDITTTADIEPVKIFGPAETPNDSGDESRPVADLQKDHFNNIRKKILDAHKEGNNENL